MLTNADLGLTLNPKVTLKLCLKWKIFSPSFLKPNNKKNKMHKILFHDHSDTISHRRTPNITQTHELANNAIHLENL